MNILIVANFTRDFSSTDNGRFLYLTKKLAVNNNRVEIVTTEFSHGDYASGGLPVVSTQENEEYRALVEAYNMGCNCKNNDAVDLANKNERLITDKKLREQMGTNAWRCVGEKFDRKNSYIALISEILGGICHLHDYIVLLAFVYESSRMEAIA